MNNKKIINYISYFVAAILIVYYYNSPKNSEKSNKTYSNIYIVNASDDNRVHFYSKPDLNKRKKAYFNSKDTISIQKIENNFGYTVFLNKNNQQSEGWIKLEDLISINYSDKNKVKESSLLDEAINNPFIFIFSIFYLYFIFFMPRKYKMIGIKIALLIVVVLFIMAFIVEKDRMQILTFSFIALILYVIAVLTSRSAWSKSLDSSNFDRKINTLNTIITGRCPYCKKKISTYATKCPHCTSDL